MSDDSNSPKIVYITAGAGGMYCGSCIRDNALATSLENAGWDVLLLPLYTPIRVDEEDRSVDQVFFGGINVYLQQKIPLFRHLPGFLDRWLDNPSLIRRVASKSVSVSAKELGAMTLSMVQGENGYQKKEVLRLVHWLRDYVKPDLICLTNLLVGGSLPALKRELGIPVLVTLQGDDVFLDELTEPWRDSVLAEMKRLACEADGFITFSRYYQKHIGDLFGIPEEKFFLTPLGINTGEFATVVEKRADRISGKTVGFFARLSPEKGFDIAVAAFLRLAKSDREVRFCFGGWLSEKDEKFFEAQLETIRAAGFEDRFERVDAKDGEGKKAFFEKIDVFTVPARFVEPKGLSVLESLACGIPVVVPARGAYPEMFKSGDFGALCEPEDAASTARELARLLDDPERARDCGAEGLSWVQTTNSLEATAEATGDVFKRVLQLTE